MKITGTNYECGQKLKGVGHGFEKLRSYLTTLSDNLLECNKESDISSGSFLLKLHNTIIDNFDNFMLNIGGDHTIGCATASATKVIHPNTSLVWIDAHGDFNTYNSSITKNLHGMPLNSLVNGSKTFNDQEDFKWLGNGYYKPNEIVIIGVRDIDPEEMLLLKTLGIRYYGMFEIKALGMERIAQLAVNDIDPLHENNLHISFDVDSLCYNEFPATGCINPGGITLVELKQLLSSLRNHRKFNALDIVEYNPSLDIDSSCYLKMIDMIGHITKLI